MNLRWYPLLALLAAATPALPKPPKERTPEILFLENSQVKIGIDRSMGASITWLSWKAYPKNMVNIHDPGRLIQQSYYAGERLDRQEDGQHAPGHGTRFREAELAHGHASAGLRKRA